MKKIDLRETTQKCFGHRPDEAYTFEVVCQMMQWWETVAYQCRRGEACIRAGSAATSCCAW